MQYLFPPGLFRQVRSKFLLTALLAVANMVLLLAFVLPAQREQALLTATAARRENSQVAQQAETSVSGMVAEQFQSNQSDLAAFAGQMLPRAEFEKFLGELFDFSYRAGLVLDNIHYAPSLHSDQQILEYRLRFNLGGRYEQLRQFISLLENSPRLIAIQTLRFSGKGEESGLISVDMEIDTFFQLEGS